MEISNFDSDKEIDGNVTQLDALIDLILIDLLAAGLLYGFVFLIHKTIKKFIK